MILQVTSISATISWEIPSQQYAAVTSYQVEYRQKYPAGLGKCTDNFNNNNN